MADPAQIAAAIARFVRDAYAALDRVDYYRMLGVSSAASPADIREAYYKLAARLHPDVHGLDVDPGYHAQLTAVYSRVVEAYKVLSDTHKRKRYDESLAHGQKRLSAGAQVEDRREQDELNPKARRFYELGRQAMADGNPKSAIINFKLAQSMQPGSELLRRELAAAERAAK